MRLKAFNIKKEKNPVEAQIKRNKILFISLIGLCLLTFIIYQTYAIYQLNNEANLTNTKVGEFTSFDIKLIPYIDNEESDTFPSSTDGYVFEKAECTEGAEGSWNNDTWSFITSNLTKPTECNIYFKEATYCDLNDCDELRHAILSTYGKADAIQELPTSTFASVANTEATSGLFKMADDYGTSYYFRGHRDYVNNNVIFAGFQWKIIRINGDGSVRLIYNGTEAEFNSTGTVNITGANTQLTSTTAYNSTYSDNTYVGYKYGTVPSTTYANATSNTTNSTIKTAVDNWYRDNIANQGTEVTNKIADKIFCNDRELQTGTGYGTNATYYAARRRLDTNTTPKLTCTQENDQYTVASGRLTYPVGLITADEVSVAGGVYGITNNTYYLHTNQNYWTMTPINFDSGSAREFYVSSYGYLNFTSVYYVNGARPSINLSSTVTISSGDGTSSNPYRIL